MSTSSCTWTLDPESDFWFVECRNEFDEVLEGDLGGIEGRPCPYCNCSISVAVNGIEVDS